MKAKIILIFFLIVFLGTNAQTTYKDIAPIIISNCVSCHHTGGTSFPLTTYSDLLARGSLVKYDVQINRMPPWPADPSYKHFARERVISSADKTKLIDWINAGLPAGDTTKAPSAPKFNKSQLNGTPDLVIKFPKYTSTSTTSDKYICLNMPNGLTQDRMIRAFEFVPSNPSIIHHAVMTIDTTNTAVNDYSGFCNNFQGQVNIGDFAPGTGPTVFPGEAPNKMGMRMKANSIMSIQLHIPGGTAGQEDSSEIHFYFYPAGSTDVRELFFETILQNWSFNIPANDSVVTNAFYPKSGNLTSNISLFSAWPHSHKTCKSIINYAYKTTDTIRLINIPKWDFRWQMQYIYDTFIKIPMGYKIISKHKFDNTTNNPNTPDPNTPVSPGLTTNDEMHFDSYIYCAYKTGDENISIGNVLAKDPLLNVSSISNKEQTILKVSTFPNPFSSSVHIDFSLSSAQYVQVIITNMLGQEVGRMGNKILSPGSHSMEWSGKDKMGIDLQKGSYFYTLNAGLSKMSGMIVKE